MHYKERCNVASSADPKYNMLLRSFQYKVGNKVSIQRKYKFCLSHHTNNGRQLTENN